MDRKNSSGGLWFLVPLGFAALFLLKQMLPWISKILMTLLGIVVCLAVVVIVLTIYFSKHSNREKETQAQSRKEEQSDPMPTAPPENPREQPVGTLEQMRILSKGRSHLMELRALGARIRNVNVCKRSEDVCKEIERILNVLQKQPEDIDRVRQFFNYYLPTLGNILVKYLRLEEGNVVREETTVKVMSCLREIQSAMEKQYEALYDNDLVDLTVEMEALTLACKRDGLLVSEDFTLREGDREISLTL
ncbi:MAG: 5-bromo-4-chloroindolyl phosphate hydrolysis family protein [Oscillospiraceae bacterium]|nr:5-bromo-4-chloroindolyl phosphate hydrolysis family protein [Oscillospiraceae bacterium]